MYTTREVEVMLVLIGILMTVCGLVPYVIYQSLYMLRTNEKIVFYRFGQFWCIVLGRTYWDHSWSGANNAPNRAKVHDPSTVRVGFFGGGWTFGLWPFYLGYRVPTDQFEVPLYISQMYTDESNEDYPRVRVEGDATLQFRLSDNPIHLGLVFSLFKQDVVYYLSKTARDLTNHDVIIRDDGGGVAVKKIALLFYNVVNKPMQEAMRAAATKFTFSVSPSRTAVATSRDIIKLRKEFEEEIRAVLTEDDDTIFMQGKLLKRVTLPDNSIRLETGDSLMVCNIVVERIQLQPATDKDAEATKAIDFSFIGHQEGLRQQAVERLRRIGEAEGIDALANKLGLTDDKQKAFLMDVIRSKAGEIKLSSINVKDASDVLSAIEGFLKKTTP